MNPYYYTTILPERPLEPPDCWSDTPNGEDNDGYSPFDEYDRAEDEMSGKTGLRLKH